MDAVVPERVRRQAAAERRAWRSRSGRVERRGKAGAGKGQRRTQTARRENEGSAEGQGEGCASHVPPDRFAVMPRGRRWRDERLPATHAEGGGAAGAVGTSDSGSESGARAGEGPARG